MIAVKAHRVGTHNPNARFRQEFTIEDVLRSAMVSDPLRLYEICPVSDGAAARGSLLGRDRAQARAPAGLGRGERGRHRSLRRRTAAGSRQRRSPRTGTRTTARPRSRCARRSRRRASGPTDLDLVELQDNTVYYELAFPEDWGLCQVGEAERLVEKGETLPTGRLPINPSGGFLCFGEATTAMGVFQVCELTWQLRGEAGARQVPNARIGLAQTLGLGGNGTALILKQ